jgi:hypothetical protein
MHGNVWEWSRDHWHGDYLRAPGDGSAWLKSNAVEAEERLLRGGSWASPRGCRSASRFHFVPGYVFDGLGFRGAFGIGCAQAVALVPGISRSGISISAGLFAGLTREAAARFSFLMATPITLGAVIWEVRKLLTGEVDVPVDGGVLAAGLVASAAAGFVAIAVLLRYLRNHPMTIFVVYRLVLAGVVVVHFLSA